MEPSKTGTDVYRSRNPRTSDYFCSVEANFDELEGIWDDRYVSRYGYWRPYTLDVIYRYLEMWESGREHGR